MSADIIKFPAPTSAPVPPENVLQGGIDANLSECILLGYKEDGTLYFASSESDAMRMLWMCEQFKRRLMAMFDDTEEPK